MSSEVKREASGSMSFEVRQARAKTDGKKKVKEKNKDDKKDEEKRDDNNSDGDKE
jgi:hypothetical protein